MEAVARFDKMYSDKDVEGGAFAATLSQIIEAHNQFPGLGETGEYILGKLSGDSIVFLLRHRHVHTDNLPPVSISSEFAGPMRRALAGESGIVVDYDYRGVKVLAAFEYVGILDLGIVSKIDVAEIRAVYKSRYYCRGDRSNSHSHRNHVDFPYR